MLSEMEQAAGTSVGGLVLSHLLSGVKQRGVRGETSSPLQLVNSGINAEPHNSFSS